MRYLILNRIETEDNSANKILIFIDEYNIIQWMLLDRFIKTKSLEDPVKLNFNPLIKLDGNNIELLNPQIDNIILDTFDIKELDQFIMMECI